MRHRIRRWVVLLALLGLAACSVPSIEGAATTTPTPTPTNTPPAAPNTGPTPVTPAGFTLYTSADHAFQIAYPAGWKILGDKTHIQFTGPGQLFEVIERDSKPGEKPAETVNAYCQLLQSGVAANPVRTSIVKLAGQDWTRANCDAGAHNPAIILVVEVVIYQGATYQIDYMSPIVTFAQDNRRYYTPMERTFWFLR